MKKVMILAITVLFIMCLAPFCFAINIHESTTGSETANSDIFKIEANSNNSHNKLLDFWYTQDGKIGVVIERDSKASSKKIVSYAIGGQTINDVYIYDSFSLTSNRGETKIYNEGGGSTYVVAYINPDSSFLQDFAINLNVGAGGFNIVTSASVKFIVLVKHNINGTEEIDWEQSVGSEEEGVTYTINSRTDTGYTYDHVTVERESNNTTQNYTTSQVSVVSEEEKTTVTFYYLDVPLNITVTKAWNDPNNFGNKPNQIRIVLYADNVQADSHIINTQTENSTEFLNLPKKNNNVNIVYTVGEEEINQGDLSDYISQITGDMENGFIITNTYDENSIIDTTKTGTTQITHIDDRVSYTISNDITIDSKHVGTTTIEIVDTLPYGIDQTKEYNLDHGTYNSSNNTIIWSGIYNSTTNVITWGDGFQETLTNGSGTISRNINMIFANVDSSATSFTNNVSSSLKYNNKTIAEDDDSSNTTLEIDNTAFIKFNNTVYGNAGDQDKYFKYKVEIDANPGDVFVIEGQDATVEYGGTTITTSSSFVYGQDNYVYLKHGQEATITVIGQNGESYIGNNYTITQIDNNYQTKVNDIDGLSTTGKQISSNDGVNRFVNYLEISPQTSRYYDITPFMISIAIITLLYGLMKIKKKEEID